MARAAGVLGASPERLSERCPRAARFSEAGITRAVVADLAPGLGLKVLEGVFSAEDLTAADEAFLSSSTREIMPVIDVDGTPIAGAHPGPAAADLQAATNTALGRPGARVLLGTVMAV